MHCSKVSTYIVPYPITSMTRSLQQVFLGPEYLFGGATKYYTVLCLSLKLTIFTYIYIDEIDKVYDS